MKIIDHIFMALKRLRLRFFESLVIIIAIGLGTGVICVALALTFAYTDQASMIQDSKYNMQIRIQSGEDNIFSMSSGITRVGERIPVPAKLTLDVIHDIKNNCNTIQYVFIQEGRSISFAEPEETSRAVRGPMTMEEHEQWMKEWEKYNLQVRSITPDYFGFNELHLAEGNLFTDYDVKEGNRVIVLGPEAAQRLFPEGDPIGKKVLIVNQQPLTVIGVLKPIEEDSRYEMVFNYENNYGYIPVTVNTYPHEVDGEREYNLIIAVPKDPKKMEEAEREINAYLKGLFTEGYTVSSNFTAMRDIREIVFKGQIIAGLAASLGLLIAAINILNLMMARVLRRTKEIGILVALGSSRRSIFSTFLWEAMLMGLFGALLGFGISIVGEKIVTSLLEYFPINIDYRVFLSAVGISGFISLLFGIYPALQGARVNPVDALRTD